MGWRTESIEFLEPAGVPRKTLREDIKKGRGFICRRASETPPPPPEKTELASQYQRWSQLAKGSSEIAEAPTLNCKVFPKDYLEDLTVCCIHWTPKSTGGWGGVVSTYVE